MDVYGPWDMFIIDEHDRIVAHSFRPELIGQDVKTLIDSDGSEFGQAIATATEADLFGDVFGEGVKVSYSIKLGHESQKLKVDTPWGKVWLN